MECKYCNASCKKKGEYKGVQKWQCKSCGKHQREIYRQKCYDGEIEQQIALLNNEGMGIRSIGRILKMPKSSVQLLLLKVSRQIQPPVYNEIDQVYEVDELFACIGSSDKLCYIIYAINRNTRKVIDFVIGARTKINIGKIIKKLLNLSPKQIYTDKLPVFTYTIPKGIHKVFRYKTNRIERNNLTLRTHLKRLSRKTICYSKSEKMLEACFRLYIWKGC